MGSLDVVLRVTGAISLVVSASVGLTAIVLEAIDAYRDVRDERPAA